MKDKFKINRYGDVVTIDVERKHATALADYLFDYQYKVTEVILQHATNKGKIIIKQNEPIDVKSLIWWCKFYFIEHGKKF